MSRVQVGAKTDAMGPVRAMGAGDVARIKRARAAGVPVRELARLYGVSPRTVYRYLLDERQAITVTIGDWQADFWVGDHRVPVRLTEWRIRPLDPAETAALVRRTIDELEDDLVVGAAPDFDNGPIPAWRPKPNDYGPEIVARAGDGR